MPMPALNIIETQETVLNSGSSSSRPSVMLPYRLMASHSTNTTKPLEVSTNSQPVLAIVQDSESPETFASEDVLTKPQIRKATAIAAETPKTTLSRPPRAWVASSTGTSSAGWSSSVGAVPVVCVGSECGACCVVTIVGARGGPASFVTLE